MAGTCLIAFQKSTPQRMRKVIPKRHELSWVLYTLQEGMGKL